MDAGNVGSLQQLGKPWTVPDDLCCYDPEELHFSWSREMLEYLEKGLERKGKEPPNTKNMYVGGGVEVACFCM